MSVQYTSAAALQQHAETLNTLQAKVLFIIEQGDEKEGITNHEIAHLLGVETATISGRTRPLVLEGKVRELKKRKCKITGNTVIAWTTQPKNNQPTLNI